MEKENNEILKKSLRISLSVFLCILFLQVFFKINPFYASIAAVSCLQGPVIHDSFRVGIERIIGTIFGGTIGLVAVYFITTEANSLGASAIIGICMALIISGCTYILKKPSSSAIACIVFLGITTNMEGRNPYFWAGKRIATTIFGVIVALTVNWFITGEYKKTTKKFIKRKKGETL